MKVALLNIVMTALIAAMGGGICDIIKVPVWMMFAGWIAFLAGGGTVKTAPVTLVCVLLGAILGIMGAFAIAQSGANLGSLALPVAVFVIVAAALLAQFFPVFNTVICYFCGMTIFFSSGLPPAAASLLGIGIGVAIGIASGLLASALSMRMTARAAANSG
jgi:hypothetical protein